ncbi:MAG: hypothetical protein R2694_15270 [Ilumatobacteraceae bacterium]
MANWLITRQLTKVGAGWHRCGAELTVIDEQAMYLDDDAADAELQAASSANPVRRLPRARSEGGHALPCNATAKVVESGGWNAAQGRPARPDGCSLTTPRRMVGTASRLPDWGRPACPKGRHRPSVW